MNKIDYQNIKNIETKGMPLGDFADIKVGIATLKDNLYFVDGSKIDGDYYLKEYGGKEYQIEKEITRKITKIASVNSDKDIISDKRRIIFPYLKNGKTHILIEENEFKNKFPKCYYYLTSVKNELGKRDKGKTKIPVWYAYGRGQGLNFVGKKLLTKTFSNVPNFMLDENEYSLFCNGYAIFPKNDEDLQLLRKIINSRIMDYYVRKTSVEIEGDYQCYQKNFIQTFSIPNLTQEQKEFLLNTTDNKEINNFLIKIYELNPTSDLVL